MPIVDDERQLPLRVDENRGGLLPESRSFLEPPPPPPSAARQAASLVPAIGLPLIAAGATVASGGTLLPAMIAAGGAGFVGEKMRQDIVGEPENDALGAVEGLLSMIPGVGGAGKTIARTVGRRAAEGAGLGFLGSYPRQMAEQESGTIGERFSRTDTGRALTEGAFGGVLGGAIGGVEGGFTRGVDGLSPIQRGARNLEARMAGRPPGPMTREGMVGEIARLGQLDPPIAARVLDELEAAGKVGQHESGVFQFTDDKFGQPDTLQRMGKAIEAGPPPGFPDVDGAAPAPGAPPPPDQPPAPADAAAQPPPFSPPTNTVPREFSSMEAAVDAVSQSAVIERGSAIDYLDELRRSGQLRSGPNGSVVVSNERLLEPLMIRRLARAAFKSDQGVNPLNPQGAAPPPDAPVPPPSGNPLVPRGGQDVAPPPPPPRDTFGGIAADAPIADSRELLAALEAVAKRRPAAMEALRFLLKDRDTKNLTLARVLTQLKSDPGAADDLLAELQARGVQAPAAPPPNPLAPAPTDPADPTAAAAAAGTQRANQIRQQENDLRLKRTWERLMGAQDAAGADGIAAELSPEDAETFIRWLDAAPGDNPNARAALEKRTRKPLAQGAPIPFEAPVDTPQLLGDDIAPTLPAGPRTRPKPAVPRPRQDFVDRLSLVVLPEEMETFRREFERRLKAGAPNTDQALVLAAFKSGLLRREVLASLGEDVSRYVDSYNGIADHVPAPLDGAPPVFAAPSKQASNPLAGNIEPVAAPEQPSAPPIEPAAPPAPIVPDAEARRLLALSDDAADVPPVTPEDVQRAQTIATRPVGAEVRMLSPSSRKVYRARWRALSLDDVELNDRRVQPRNRGSADEAARMEAERQAREIAANPQADVLMAGNDLLDAGAPVILPAGILPAGNGRMTGLRLARRDNPAGWAEFQRRQSELAELAGFTPEQLAGIPDVVLVRELTSPVDDLLKFADETNVSRQMQMSAPEQAVADARRMSDELAGRIDFGEDEALDKALLRASNRPVIRDWLATVPQNEHNRLLTEAGEISQYGIERFKAALLAKAFPGPDGASLVKAVTERTDSAVKLAEAGLVGALPRLARARAAFEAFPQADITKDVTWAVRKLRQLRESNTNVGEYLDQMGMFGVDAERTPRRDALLRFLGESRSAKKIREAIGRYADAVDTAFQASKQGSFDQNTLDLLEDAIGDGQLGLLGNQRGAVEPPAFIRRILQYLADSENVRMPPNRPNLDQRDRGPIPKTRKKSLGQMGLTEAGNSPAPPPAIELLDSQGNPIPRTGDLSSDVRDRLAPSLLDDVRDEDSLLNFKNKIALAGREDVAYARRYVRSHRETLSEARALAAELADRMGEDVDEFLRVRDRGQNLNAEQLGALLGASDEIMSRFTLAAERAARTGDPGDVAEAYRMLQIYKGVMLQEAGAVAEAGRALNILNAARQARGENAKALRLALEKVGGDEDRLREIFDEFLKMGDDPIGRHRLLKFAATESKWDKLVKFRLAFMLSNPKTHLVNMMGNSGALASRIGQRVTAAGIDAARVAMFGGERDRFMGEALADLQGMAQPFRAGARAAREAFDEAQAVDHASRLVGMRQGFVQGARAWLRAVTSNPVPGAARGGSKFDVPTGRMQGIMLSPLRALQMEDELFKSVGYFGDLHARAYRQAAKEGLRGAERMERMAEILAKPSRELVEAAKYEALYRTFQDESGEFTKRLLGLRDTPIPRSSGVRPMQLLLPFVKTPVKLARFSATHSPLGILNTIYKAQKGDIVGGEIVDEAAKAAMGTVLAGAVTALALDGWITGSGPSDEQQQRAWRNLGNQPYSVYLGDRLGWVSYQRLDPAAIAIGVVADAVEAADVEPEDFAAKVGLAFGNNVTNKTYMQGLSDFMEALSDPDRYGEKFVSSMVGSAVPAVVAQVARVHDPTVRRPTNVREALASRIPGLRGYVAPIRNVWGEPIVEEGNALERSLSPFMRTVPKQDPATQELARLRVAPGSPTKELALGAKGLRGSVEWTPEDYERYSFASGQMAKARVSALIRTPQYQALRGSPELQADQIRAQFRIARETVRDAMRPQAIRNSAGAGLIGPGGIIPAMPPILPGTSQGLPRAPSP